MACTIRVDLFRAMAGPPRETPTSMLMGKMSAGRFGAPAASLESCVPDFRQLSRVPPGANGVQTIRFEPSSVPAGRGSCKSVDQLKLLPDFRDEAAAW